jgi:hypothetical protein
MTGEVGFGKQTQPGDAARSGELVPLRLAHRMQRHCGDHLPEQSAEAIRIGERRRIAPMGFD